MTISPHRSWAKDLDAATLYELLKLRVEVFVVEQATPYPELDGRDLLAETRHFWLEDPDDKVISTLRLMEEHPGGEKVFRIGRVCTKRSERGHGHTSRLMQAALAEVGDDPCRINAQTYLEEMYSKHGFVRDGDEFLDDGIRTSDVAAQRTSRFGLTRCHRVNRLPCPPTGSRRGCAATHPCWPSTPVLARESPPRRSAWRCVLWNQGFDVAVFQFVKSAKWKVGEEAAFRELGRMHDEHGVGGPVEWHKMGAGWSWSRKPGSEVDHAAAAADGWAEISRRLAEQRHDFYVLDEFTYPLKWGWVDVDAVVATLTDRPGTQHVVITGRDAPQRLLDAADLVTEMTKVKHPMDAGRKGQRGIEW